MLAIRVCCGIFKGGERNLEGGGRKGWCFVYISVADSNTERSHVKRSIK